jgi:hypothetical protein
LGRELIVDNAPGKKKIRRTAVTLAVIALVFYGGFMLTVVLLAGT